MINELIGFVFKHDDKDYSLWLTDAISETDRNKIAEILEKYDTTGCSVRNVYDDIERMMEL